MLARPELHGTFGAVASTHWLASSAGMAVLERGGNAVDAAAAAAFVLHVVEPHLNGPGGDAPIIVRSTDGDVSVLCGQGPTGQGATLEAYVATGATYVPGTGLLAAVIPGAVMAWCTLVRDKGTWAPADVLAFAIDLADNGHHVLPRVAATIGAQAEYFTEHWQGSAALWLADGVPQPWQRIRNRQLAATYRTLVDAAHGAAHDNAWDKVMTAWSEGFVAEAIDAFVATEHMDSTGTPHHGFITGNDLASWRPAWEPTVSRQWRGRTIHKCGAWSQGPALLQQLALLEPLLPAQASRFDADLVHLAVEATKLAFADRDAWFADGADLSALFDDTYLAERRSLISDQASAALRPGSALGTPRIPDWIGSSAAAAGIGEPTRGDTCHIDVVDRDGLVVSATPSGGWLQSSPTIPELGFCLGTRAQMLWLEPGLPTSMAPGVRPRTTLSPTLVEHDDGTIMAMGTPGGDQQDQWQLTMLLGMGVLGLEPQAAIEAPSWHSTSIVSSFDPRIWEPAGLVVESRLGADTIAELQARGHIVTDAGPWSLGRLSAASWRRDEDGVSVRAAANPRGEQGYAVAR